MATTLRSPRGRQQAAAAGEHHHPQDDQLVSLTEQLQQHHAGQQHLAQEDQPVAVSLAEHDALALLLQHPAITSAPRLVLALAATSARVRAAVAHQCRGALHVEYSGRSVAEAQRLACWLARWSGCLATLELEWNRVNLCEVEAAIGAALRQCAAGGPAAAGGAAGEQPVHSAGGAVGADACWAGPPRFQALKANAAGPLLLDALPPSLARLELGHVGARAYAPTWPQDAVKALHRLTGLQTLTILSDRSVLLLPATSALTCLTSACLLISSRDLYATASMLASLPPQLRKLELTIKWGLGPAGPAGQGSSGDGGGAGSNASSGSSSARRPPLPLGHITGLQELRCSGYLCLHADDQLPAGLEALQAPDCHVVQPLPASLRTLSLYNSTTPAAELALLGRRLTRLQELTLGYFGSEQAPDVEASAAGWRGLPLRSLDFDANNGEFRLGGGALAALARLGTCLTQLALSGGVMVDTGYCGLANALAKLTQLHTLRLAAVELLHDEEPPAHLAAAAAAAGATSGGPPLALADASALPPVPSGAERVIAAVASLASLRSLKLGSLAWLRRPAKDLQALTAATQLSCLHLYELRVDHQVVANLAAALRGLLELDISDNAALSDATLAVLGAALPHLRSLDVSGTAVTPAGISSLREVLPAVDVVCFQSSDDDE